LAEALKVMILIVLIALALMYYGIWVEALSVQIETLIKQALAQVGVSVAAFVAFVVLAVTLLLRLFIGGTRSLAGVRS
jgi:hypothetical protein